MSKYYKAISVEEELPPIQVSASDPIIVVCSHVLSRVNDEQLREAHFKSDMIDGSEPYFTIGNRLNDALFSQDNVTHWLKESETDAIEFATWLSSNHYIRFKDTEWIKIDSRGPIIQIKDLYNLFKLQHNA